MAQVVSRRPLTAEARVRTRLNIYGICGVQSGTGTGFSPSSSVFPCQYHSTVALQTHIIWGMRNMHPLLGTRHTPPSGKNLFTETSPHSAVISCVTAEERQVQAGCCHGTSQDPAQW
jgi:hypothetical protein